MNRPLKPSIDNGIDPHDHVNLCFYMARKHAWAGEDYEELASVAYDALHRAAELFDPAKGYQFSTYACRAIHHKFLIHRRDRNVRLRTHALAEDNRGNTGGNVTRDVRRSWYDHEPDAETVEDDAARIARVFAGLDDRTREILLRRAGGERMLDVAEAFGLSKERVRQIEARAIADARAAEGLPNDGRTVSSGPHRRGLAPVSSRSLWERDGVGGARRRA